MTGTGEFNEIAALMSAGIGAGVGGGLKPILDLITAPIAGEAEARKEHWKLRRLNRMAEAAKRAAGDQVHRPNDRVLARVLEEAVLTDSEVVADYLGGVVAASGPDTDDGVPMVALISRLSSRQLLFHYMAYQALRAAATSERVPTFHAVGSNMSSLRVGVSAETLQSFSGPSGAVVDPPSIISLTRQLISEGLLEERVEVQALREFDPNAAASIRFTPTVLGAELFLWGHGVARQSAHADQIFNVSLSFDVLAETPPAFRVDEVILHSDPVLFDKAELDTTIRETIKDEAQEQQLLTPN